MQMGLRTCSTRSAVLLVGSSHCRKGLEAVQVQFTPRQELTHGSVVFTQVSSSPSSCREVMMMLAQPSRSKHKLRAVRLSATHCRRPLAAVRCCRAHSTAGQRTEVRPALKARRAALSVASVTDRAVGVATAARTNSSSLAASCGVMARILPWLGTMSWQRTGRPMLR